jgi:hypothetical protein
VLRDKRKLRRALTPLALALATAAFFMNRDPAPKSRISRENYDRIREYYTLQEIMTTGREFMTRAEVEAILGPPGDCRSGLTLRSPRTGTTVVVIPGGPLTCVAWEGDDLSIHIYVDSAGNVVSKDAMTNRLADQYTADAFLWRAKRLWRRCFP